MRLHISSPASRLRWVTASALFSCTVCFCLTVGLRAASAVTLDLAYIGNANNPADSTGFGSVSSWYRISKNAVTIGQYTEFLNAVAGSDPYSLYNPNMETNLNVAGITRIGSSGSYHYSVIGSPNRPITYVSWFDAARFANWLTNGQGSGSTETGAYTLVNGQTSGTPPARNPGDYFYIPTADQWYKAAYYSPLLNSGSGGYYDFATQSDTAPENLIGSGSNQANTYMGSGSGNTYSVTQDSSYSATQNYLTDVGAFANSYSYYGTFDQTGNVWEWTDLPGFSSTRRVIAGGSWDSPYREDIDADAFGIVNLTTDSEWENVGIRIVPEPSTWVMGLAGIACMGWGVHRSRSRNGERRRSRSRA